MIQIPEINTGAYLRVKRDLGKFENIPVEFLTNEERIEKFSARSPEEIINWLNLVCNHLASAYSFLDTLKTEGLFEANPKGKSND